LAGFAIGGLIESPDFTSDDTVYPEPMPIIFQSLYGLSMLASSMYCFAATGIALHSINRISNVCPSKTAVAYMTINIFFDARDSVNTYVFRGMASACLGIITAFIWGNQNLYYGIPAAVVCTLALCWFIAVYRQWDKMTTFHSDVGDKLCAKDLSIAAEKRQSITEGIWS